MQEHPIRVKLTELEKELNDTRASSVAKREYEHASGVNFALERLRATIDLCDSLGLFDPQETDQNIDYDPNDWTCVECGKTSTECKCN